MSSILCHIKLLKGFYEIEGISVYFLMQRNLICAVMGAQQAHFREIWSVVCFIASVANCIYAKKLLTFLKTLINTRFSYCQILQPPYGNTGTCLRHRFSFFLGGNGHIAVFCLFKPVNGVLRVGQISGETLQQRAQANIYPALKTR